MLHHVQHYANKAEPASLVGFLLFNLILFYFGANYAIMTLQELCKTCASVVGRVFFLFSFGTKWQDSCTILVQELYLILFYCKCANRFRVEVKVRISFLQDFCSMRISF